MDTSPEYLKSQLDSPFLTNNNEGCQAKFQDMSSINLQGDLSYIDMKKRWPRFIVLALACYMKFSTYFIATTPGSIQQELLIKYHITNVEYGMLFSIYSIPNIFLSLVTGFVIDRMGIRKSTIYFTFFILFGQMLFALSSYIESYDLALIGRLILGIMITIAKAGVSMTNLITPQILVATGSITYCLEFGVLLQSVAFLGSLAYAKLDKVNEDHLKRKQEREQLTLIPISTDVIPNQGFISLTFIKNLRAKFWVFSFVCMLSYCTYGPFQNNMSMILRTRFGFGILEAGEIMVIQINSNQSIFQAYLAVIATALCPFIGYVSDKVNRRIMSLAFASLVLTVSHFYTALLPDIPRSLHVFLPLVMYELGLGLFMSNMWAALNELVDKQRLGFGVGLVNSAQNIGQAIAPIMIGIILDQSQDDKMLGFRQISYFMAFITLTFFIILLCWSVQIYTREKSVFKKYYHTKNNKIRNGSETLL
eukprot:403362335